MTLNNYCTSTMKIITLLSTSIEKHFILIFKTLVSHDVFMAHFHMCKLWTELWLFYSMAFLHLNVLKFYYKTEYELQIKYTTVFAPLSCQLGKH